MTFSEESQEFQVTTYELPSGMKVHLREDHSSNLIALAMTVGAGSRTEGKWLGTGISHLVEHLTFRGAHEGAPSQIAEKIEQHGGEINAYTTNDFTLYYISLPKASIDIGLDVLFNSLKSLEIDHDSLEREKQVVLHEVKMGEDDHGRVLQKLLWKTAYRIHPYHVKTIGYESLLMSLSQEDVAQYFEHLYVPENISLTLVGDFNSNEAMKWVDERFGQLERRPFSYPVIPSEPEMSIPREEELFSNVQLTRLVMGFHIPGFGHNDMFALDVLSMIAGDGTQSRLYERLQNDLRLTRSIGSSTTSTLDPGLFVVSSQFPEPHLSNVKREIWNVLDQFRKEVVTEEELDRAKKRIITDYYRQLDSVDRQAFWIGMLSYLTGDPNYILHYLKKIKAVSGEDILRVAQKYFSLDKMVTCALRPKESEFSKVKTQEVQTHPKVLKQKLPNGALLIAGFDHSIPIISVQAVFKGGVIAEKDTNNGIFDLMVKTAIRGTSQKNFSQIFGPIEAAGGDLSSFAEQNIFGFSMTLPKDQLLEALSIFVEILNSASFPEDEISKQKDQSLASIQQVEESPGSSGIWELKKKIFGEHPYHFLTYGSSESISKLTRNDLRETFQKYCKPSNAVISIYGDIPSDGLLKEAADLISQWKAPAGDINLLSQRHDVDGPLQFHQYKEQEQSLVMIGFLGTTVRDEDRYGLQVLATMFSGFSSPLFKKIRNELGAAYYMGAFNLFGLDPGAFIIYAGTTPEKESEVLKVMEESLKQAIDGEIDPKDLLRAKNQLIGEMLRDLQFLSSKARELAKLEVYGLGVEELDRYEAKIRSLKVEDVVTIAKKYFVSKNQVTLVISPEKEIQNSGDASASS